MITFSLQSGSNGNCIYVEAGGMKILFDAGISGKLAEFRLKEYGRDIRDCQALFISHDHSDHIRCAGIYQRKFGLPIYVTRPTLQAARGLGRLRDVRLFHSGRRIAMGPVTISTVRTPHDAADGLSFVVEHEGKRLGILTDLGHPFQGLSSTLSDLDAAYLESNYDPQMLETGRYPPALKDRIRGKGGHLSNIQSALLVKQCVRSRLRWICIAHLSEENNHPELALATHHKHIGRDFPIYLASRYETSPLLSVR